MASIISQNKEVMMAEGDARIRIKLGQVEIEYEGKADFLKDELIKTVKKILELQKVVPANILTPPPEPPEAPANASEGTIELSTDTIANLIKATTGSDLTMAAAAHLHFAKGKKTFTRQEIAKEMRKTPHYFKETYASNLSKSLKLLTKGQDRLRSPSPGVYSLSNAEKKKLEATLADA